ncbi:ribosome small subunit-dependent GTPase A [Hydrocarboniphaga sp.]|uniref:ribosome small subunit-dependent GTPase A n=1 Tax=Hydrocarboniphaga sp. TaxID=2033016 RepID=UPI002ABADC0B|nr:ribosome small subunit-dependent GTPase A [Hydrocarboniphaga sp.]MDZ4078531.1 ribosome small subunit-dependent GTPase A [Hydrocarboniphaga sp.]
MSSNRLPPALAGLGWTERCSREFAALDLRGDAFAPARVVEQHRHHFVVHDGLETASVEMNPALLQSLRQQDDGLSVGDWVVLDRSSDPQRIAHCLPRSSLLVRGMADGSRQRIVANADCALLVMGLDGDYSPNRLERYLLTVRSAGLMPVVLLTKPDRCEDVDARIEEIQRLAGPATPVHALDPRHDDVPGRLAPYRSPGTTLVLLGSSGVGKSTCMNALLGVSVQKTQATREGDDTGKHTTTVRSLRQLPGGACLIDTPGLRELRLAGRESVEKDAFDDVAALAAQCRYSDCAHEREPGCAVVAGLPAERLASYRKLRDELTALARSPRQMAERKQQDKQVHQAQKRFRREHDKRR